MHASHIDAVHLNPNNSVIYGVNGPCAFGELENFEVTKCLPPDIMHDLLEGVIPAVVKVVLRVLVRGGFLTYEQVGRQMTSFKYGKNDATSKPVSISARTLRQNDNIAGSASQKLCLFRLLSFIFSEFVPEGNEVWELYLCCREIVDILSSTCGQEVMASIFAAGSSRFERNVF